MLAFDSLIAVFIVSLLCICGYYLRESLYNLPVYFDIIQRRIFDVLNNISFGDVIECAVCQTQVNYRRRRETLNVERVFAPGAAEIIDRVVAHYRRKRSLARLLRN